MSNAILMTAEGYEQLKAELDDLKTVKRKDISEKIRVARGFGDLSENSEYDEAKNEQAVVEARISKLEEQLKNAKIIAKDQIKGDVVAVGTKVTILDLEYDDELEYAIASSVESNSQMNSITDESPLGKGLIGHKVGDIVEISAPAGVLKFKVTKISL